MRSRNPMHYVAVAIVALGVGFVFGGVTGIVNSDAADRATAVVASAPHELDDEYALVGVDYQFEGEPRTGRYWAPADKTTGETTRVLVNPDGTLSREVLAGVAAIFITAVGAMLTLGGLFMFVAAVDLAAPSRMDDESPLIVHERVVLPSAPGR